MRLKHALKRIFYTINGRRSLVLHRMLIKGHANMAMQLLQRATPYQIRQWICAKDAEGMTALHMASLMDSQLVAEMLLQFGAGANVPDRFGLTPLHLAASCASVAMVRTLLLRGANPLIADGLKRTALTMAHERAQNDIISLVLHESMRLRGAHQVSISMPTAANAAVAYAA